MSSSWQVLVDLAAARPPRSPELVGPGVVASAVEQRVDGLVHTAVRAGDLRVADHVAVELARRDLGRRQAGAALWAAWDRIEAAAADTGAEVALVKGVALEWQLYDRPGERPCRDLDVWLAPGHRSELRPLLATLAPDHPALDLDLERLRATGPLQSIDLRVDDVPVDLHLDVVKLGVPSHLDEALWTRTTVMDGPGGRRVRVPDPVAALVHLLLHLNKDRFRDLLGMADIARLVQRARPDLDEVFGLAARAGLAVPVRESLRVVVDELGLHGVVDVPADGSPSARAWRALWPRRIRLQGERGRVTHRYRQLAIPLLRPGPRSRREALRRVAWALLPPAELVRYRNPGVTGGYLRRLTSGRVRHWRRRRAYRTGRR